MPRVSQYARGAKFTRITNFCFTMTEEGSFFSEKYRENAAPETLFVIPKEQYHMFSIANQDRYKRLVISFYDMPPFCENDIKLIRDTSSDIRRIAARMKDVLECKGENAGLFLYGLFLQLLCELCEIKKSRRRHARKISLFHAVFYT